MDFAMGEAPLGNLNSLGLPITEPITEWLLPKKQKKDEGPRGSFRYVKPW